MDSLNQKALELLEKNTRTAEYKGRMYRFSVPSLEAYPFQWLWDSCFHAISFAALGKTERAKEELRGLFGRQEDNGAIYHIVFWHPEDLKSYLFSASQGFGRFLENRGFWLPLGFMRPPETSAYTQPPVLAKAVERVLEAEDDEEFLKEVLPKLYKYYNWLFKERDLNKNGLVSIFTQFESGLDYSPLYDEAIGYKRNKSFLTLNMLSRIPQVQNKLLLAFDGEKIYEKGRFHQEDVLFNSILIQSLNSLERLAQKADNEEIARWAGERAAASLKALIAKTYDENSGLFYNLNGKEEGLVKVKTIGSLMPLIIEKLPPDIAKRIVEEHLLNTKEFFTPYSFASVARSEEAFAADSLVHGRLGIWRGPMSMNTNWFLISALKYHGYADVAEYIAKKSRKLASEHGFWEFYNPLTGEPLGAENFGWATLVVDM